MSRLSKIQKYSVSWIWESMLKDPFSRLNCIFQEITLVDEVLPYELYHAYIQIKSHSKENEFLKLEIVFNSMCRPNVFIHPMILHSLKSVKSLGNILLDKR